jgi:hypothetical protein
VLCVLLTFCRFNEKASRQLNLEVKAGETKSLTSYHDHEFQVARQSPTGEETVLTARGTVTAKKGRKQVLRFREQAYDEL